MEMGDAFHAYIIDWRLPDMNGIEVTRQIRSLGDDTPIIILTSYDWSDIEVEARAAGVTAFCAKPLFMSDIRDTLMTAIGQSQAEVEDSILPEAGSDFRGRCILTWSRILTFSTASAPFPARKLFSVHGSLWNWEMRSTLISLTGVCQI